MPSEQRFDRLCNGCGIVRTFEEFTFKNEAAGKRRSQCRICCREASKRHYLDNRPAYLARSHRNNPRLREAAKRRVYEYLLEHPCAACGESDVVVLEFNHRDPSTKSSNISDMIRQMSSAARIDAEIAKCDVLCANCHQRLTTLARKVHYRVSPPWLRGSGVGNPRHAANIRNARIVLEHLADSVCVDCGECDLLVLQFDHREHKAKDVSWLVGSGCPPQRLVEELKKCDVRCANCHRRRTARVGGWFRVRRLGADADYSSRWTSPGEKAGRQTET